MAKRNPVTSSKLRKASCLFFGCVLLSNAATAQNDTTRKLNEVRVEGARPQKLESVTPAQQITAKDFVRTSSFNVADAIRNFAGVNIRDYGGIGGLKTVSVRSLGANHTAVLLDGVQINDAQNGQIDLSKFTLTNVQSITLYNGQPDDLLQPARSFAAASVLNLQPVRPQLSPPKPYQVLAGVKGGSFGLTNPYLQWQQRLSAKWSLVANANYTYANGRYKYKVDGDGSDTLAIRRNGDIKALQTDAALYWNSGDSSRFSLRVNQYSSKRGLPGAVIFYNPVTTERLDNNDLFVQAGYSHTWPSNLRLLLNTKLSRLKTHYLDSEFLNQQGYLEQRYNQREAYQSAALAYHITNNWEVSYAVDASFIRMDADIFNYAYPERFTLLNALATSFTAGRWKLQGNLLQTNINETVERGTASASRSVLTPTLVATFKPFERSDLQVRGFYKSIVRAPTLDELYFYAIVPRSIKPEFVHQYDAGITYSNNLDKVLQYIALTADIYYNNVRDKIIAIPNKNPAIFSFNNIGKVNIKGADVGLKTQTRQMNGWSAALSVNYTYQQAQDVTDPSSDSYLSQIPYTPKHTVAINAGVNYGQAGLYFNHIVSSSRYYTINNLPEYKVQGYSLSDLSAIYKFMAGKLPAVASIEINNLFNTNYAVIRSYPMPGRSYRLSFQITI